MLTVQEVGYVAAPHIWTGTTGTAVPQQGLRTWERPMNDYAVDRAAFLVDRTAMAAPMDMAFTTHMRDAEMMQRMRVQNGFDATAYGHMQVSCSRMSEPYRPVPMAQYIQRDQFAQLRTSYDPMPATVPMRQFIDDPMPRYPSSLPDRSTNSTLLQPGTLRNMCTTIVDSRATTQSSISSTEEPVSQCPSLKQPWWAMETMVQFTRNLYTESDGVKGMTAQEADQFRQRRGIQCYGNNVPKPCPRVMDLICLPETLHKQLAAEVLEPEPITSQVWPVALSGRDVLAVGTPSRGSTLSYVIPALQHVNSQPRLKPGDGPIVLIICPTREIASGVQDFCTHYGHSTSIKNAVVIGGVAKGPQIRDLGKGVEIVIGTPGRLADLLAAGATTLSRVSMAILDGADQMMELGYADHVRQMLQCIRPDRQTVILARDWNSFVQELCQTFCQDYIEVRVGVPDRVTEVRQTFEVVNDEGSKRRLLSPLLDKLLDQRQSCLVFTRAAEKADDLTMVLRSCGYPALVLPSRYVYQQSLGVRELNAEFLRVLEELRQGRSPILVACDAVARGADLPDFHVVVNFDMPPHISEYIERLRRVAREAFVGEAFSLLSPADARLAPEVVTFLEEGKHPVPQSLQDFITNMAGSRTSGDATGRLPPSTPSVGSVVSGQSFTQTEVTKKEMEPTKGHASSKESSRGRHSSKEKRSPSHSHKSSRHSKGEKTKRAASVSSDQKPTKSKRK